MSRVHLRMDGTWAPCDARLRACPRQFHLDGFSVKQVEQMPKDMLLQLFEVLDPPAYEDETGFKRWDDAQGKTHRGYDLPAVVHEGGAMQEWWNHGQLHREGDKPASISPDGTREWYRWGEWHRDNGLPAVEFPSGRKEWWVDGLRHRYGLPAVEKPDGTVEWWLDGEQIDPPGDF